MRPLLAALGRAPWGLASLRTRLTAGACPSARLLLARGIARAPRVPQSGTDTRQITRLLAEAGSLRGVLSVYKEHGVSFDAKKVSVTWQWLGKHTERLAPRLDGRGISSTCRGMALLGFEPAHATMRLLGAEAIPRISSFTPQDLATTAWAFATLGIKPDQHRVGVCCCWRRHAGYAREGGERARSSDRDYPLLHQFFLSAELELRPPAELLAPIGLRNACKQVMVDEPTASSKLHLEVSAELTRMGIAHVNELCVPKLGYHVDIAILSITDTAEVVAPLADKVAARAREAVRAATVTYRGLVIEVDGPSHYDAARRLLPATALIRRHLALVGCAVVAVPHWEWRALEDHAEKAAYLAELLCSLPPRASSRA
ncbi:hypothetical protein T492DRAFT_947671 [Pavlovales sp. CCMP2436]|nr:hypothetical protein T492DRAFT_947671 [Pavlovales sp. CCMP2436]